MGTTSSEEGLTSSKVQDAKRLSKAQISDAVGSGPLKERLKRGEICIGTFMLFLAGGDVAQFFAGLALDYFFLDMEHGSFDLSRVRETILAARASGIAPVVRVAQVEYHLVTRVLDAGAEGIVLPRVETSKEAADLVRFARYRPEGERGVSTFAGHNNFTALRDVPRFLVERNREILLIVQIETLRGVENRVEILSTPGIDGCLIGTGDLAMSLGYPGQFDHPEVIETAEKVLATCRENNVIGTIPIRKPSEVQRWQKAGIRMLTLSTDGGFLSAGAQLFLSQIKW